MLVVPTTPVASQQLQVQLASQSCTLNVFQTAYGLFTDLYVGESLIIGGVLCENLNRIVRSAYLGFAGDFVFADLEGKNDPIYTGLGSRYVLVYLEEADL